MAGVQPTKFINYISEFKKLLVTRQNGIISQKFKIDSATDDNYYFSIVNSNNRLISLTGRAFKIYGSIFDSKDQMHILFYSDKCTIEQNGQQMHFKIDTYTSQYMNIVKTNKIIDLTIVEIVNPDDNIPDEEQITQVILRDTAIAYKRPYIENQTPAEILQKVILTTNVPLTGVFGSGQDINLTIGSNGAAFGTGLTQTGDNQLVIGQYNEADATKAFIIGNGENDTARSNLFTIDYEGNIQTPGAISANAIVVDGQDVGDKVNQLENTIEAVSAAIPSVEGLASEQWVQNQGYLTAHQSLDGYATEQWVLNKGYITGVNLDPYATKDQLTAYATKSDLTVSASVLSNQISQLALNIPTKVSDLTNDAGYLTAVPSSYALKTDIPTGNAQLQNTAGYITGYNAGTGISISNGTISLTGEVGKTYYADNNTLQLNNSTNTFSIKSLSSKLNQGQNIILTPQSDGSVTINAIGGGGGGTGGATYLAGLGLSLSTVSAEDGIYKFYVNEPWLDNKINTATSGIQNLSAGTGLEIEDNVISLTAEIPSIDGLASEQWVETNFLSAIPSNYATKDYVDSSVSGKADLSSVYTKEEVYTYIETDAKINEATSGKADKSELSDYATESDLQIVSAAIPTSYVQQDAISDMATQTWVGEQGFLTEVPNTYATKTDVDNATSAMATTGWVSEQGYLTEVPNTYALKTDIPTNAEIYEAISGDVEAQITGKNYITSEALNGLATEQYVTEQVSGKADQSTVETLSTNLSAAITGVVDSLSTKADTSALDDLASEEDLQYVSGIVSAQAEDIDALKAVSGEVDYETVFDMLSSGDTDTLTITKDTTNQKIVLTAAGGGGSGDKTYHGDNGIEVDNVNDTISISANFLSANALEGYATQSWVGQQGFALTSQLPTDYTTSAQVSSIVEGYNFATEAEIPTTVAELTDASDYALKSELPSDYTTSAQVSSIVEGYDYATESFVTSQGYITDAALTDYAQLSDIPSVVSDLTNDANYISAITLSAYNASTMQNEAVQTTTIDLASTDFVTWNGKVYINDNKFDIPTDAEISGIASAVASTYIEGSTISAVSQLINDVGFVTEPRVSAIASAYAQGGGGGTTYTAGTGIDITSDVISVDQTWFENSVSSLVSGEIDSAASAAVENYIDLSGLATGTGLYYDDTDNSLNINLSADANSNMVVSADNNGVVWLSAAEGGETYTAGTGLKLEGTEFSLSAAGANENKVLSSANGTIVWADNVAGGGSTYTAGDYISLENDTIAVTGLPTNQQTISTGFTYDSKLEIAKNTYTPIDGVVTLSAFEVPAGSLDSNKVAIFEEWVNPQSTLTGFAFDGVTLTNELPSNISQTKCYVFTRRILGNGDQFISFVYEGTNQLFVPLTFTGKSATNAIQLAQTGSPDPITLQYSKNNGAWTTYSLNTVISLNQNQTIMFSGNNDHFSKNSSNYYQFKMTGTIEANGNIQSLMNYSDSCTNYCYRYMFSGCAALRSAPSLPATTLANYCYGSMFNNCSNLFSAPQLPATTLTEGCYGSMFNNCSNLFSAPQLPATTLAQDCYANMFQNCSNLSSAPQILPATTLVQGCYYQMFRGCTNLTSINVAFTSWNERYYCTYNWVYGVAANGTFTCPTALGTNQTITRGANNCPNNWTVVNK